MAAQLKLNLVMTKNIFEGDEFTCVIALNPQTFAVQNNPKFTSTSNYKVEHSELLIHRRLLADTRFSDKCDR